MDFGRLKRRSYLGGVVASLSSLAGCQGDSDDQQPADTDTSTDSAAATDATDTQDSVPRHDHSGEQAGGGALAPESVEAATVTGEQVSAGRLRARENPAGVRVVAPGELVDALDAAEPGAILRLRPERYRPGEELTVPQGVTLDFNGAFIEPESDHDVLFVDNGARLVSPTVRIPTDLRYTSTVLHYDTTRTSGDGSGGAYDPNFDQHVDVTDLRIKAPRYPDADQSESVGVHLDARGSYIMYNRLDGRISGLGTQILGTTTSENVVENEGNTLKGYINGNRLKVDLRGAQDTHVRHAGDFKMRSLIQGEIQPTTNVTAYGIVSEATGHKTVFFRGVFWDAHSMTGAATKGAGITMDLEGGHAIAPENMQNDPTRETTFYTSRDNVYGWFQRNGDGNSLGMRADDNRARFFTDENESLHLFESGGLSPPPQDLSQKSPRNLDHGALYRHDGSGSIDTRGGSSSAPGYYAWTNDGGTFVPVAEL